MPACCYASHASRCLRAVPWIAIVCTLLLVATIPVWFTFSSTAADSTQQVFRSADLKGPDLNNVLDQAGGTALFALNTVRIVALVLLIAGLGLVCLVAGLHSHHKYRQLQEGGDAGETSRIQRCWHRRRRVRLRSFVTFSAAGSSVLWLAMLVVVVLLALCTSWFLVAWGADTLLDRVSQVSSDAEGAVRRAAGSATSLVQTLQQAQLDVMDSAPADVQDTQWFQDFRRSVTDLDATVLATSGSANNTCEPGCVSLDLLAGLAGLQDNCICLSNTVAGLKRGLDITRGSLVPVLVGLLLSYVAVSWLLIGVCPYRNCSGDRRFSDAAINIHSSGCADPKLAAAAAMAPRSSSAGASSGLRGGYAGQGGGTLLQHGVRQSSDVELFAPSSHAQLFGLGRPAPISGGRGEA
ncbi:hypothetical protein COO60DRAFT_1558039 [Scenedesmus sp. NREL 46B-D3]|nr:hypothetical protein COO60DRAFT_1558039 [Scenedesmus sp. NREL 46B-D3]